MWIQAIAYSNKKMWILLLTNSDIIVNLFTTCKLLGGDGIISKLKIKAAEQKFVFIVIQVATFNKSGTPDTWYHKAMDLAAGFHVLWQEHNTMLRGTNWGYVTVHGLLSFCVKSYSTL